MFNNYDIKGCKVTSAGTDRRLTIIDCRDFGTNASGGYSGDMISQSDARTVATNANFKFIPYNHNIEIEGVKYRITGIGVTKNTVGKSILKPGYQKKETILRLES